MLKRKWALAAVMTAAIAVPVALAAGMWSSLPIVGGAAFCPGTTIAGVPGTTAVCTGGNVPAGPTAMTGLELIPADTALQTPSSVVIPSSMLGAQRTNRLIGGDFAINLWQRGTTFSSLTPTTTTMTADRWGVYSSGNTVTITKQTGTSDTIPASRLFASMRVNRPSGTDVTPICVMQVLDKAAAAPLLNNNAVFSFWALAGAGFSAASSNITANVAYYTAADSATPGTNTDAWTKATITGYVNPINSANGVAATSGLMPISTTWTRYWVSAPIPTVNTAGTAVVGLGVSICYTPVGTGGATDWLEIEGLQLEGQPSATSGPLPLGVTAPRGFEFRYPADEALLQYSYSFILAEPLSTTGVSVGSLTTTTNCKIAYLLPAVMRVAPTFTSGTITSPNNWVVRGQNTAAAVSAIATASANTVNQLSLNVTNAALTAGNACVLEGQQGTSRPVASSEP